MAPVIIDQEEGIRALLEHITARVRTERNQLLFVDLEGVNLSRSGTVAVMQLLVPPSPIVYLVDVYHLKQKTFETAIADGTDLKSVLQSQDIFKVFFDIRNDSDALHAHFRINVAGVIDLQIIEYATRAPRGRFLNDLARCIERDLPSAQKWSSTKDKGRRLFAPEAGGRYEVFLDRPLAQDIIKYCEQDIILMPQLLAIYGPKLQAGVAAQLQNIVDERIRSSKTANFNGKGPHMAVGPDLAPARRFANISSSQEVNLVRSAQLKSLCRLNSDPADDLIVDFGTMHVQATERTASNNEDAGLELAAEPDQQASIRDISPLTAISESLLASRASLQRNADNAGKHDVVESSSEEDEGYGTWGRGYADHDTGSDSGRDFTACSAEDCGYCGRCMY